jgi:hypothetical protein
MELQRRHVGISILIHIKNINKNVKQVMTTQDEGEEIECNLKV